MSSSALSSKNGTGSLVTSTSRSSVESIATGDFGTYTGDAAGDVASSALLFDRCFHSLPSGAGLGPFARLSRLPSFGNIENFRAWLHNFSVRVRLMHWSEGVAVCGADTDAHATTSASFCMNFSSIPNGIEILFLVILPQYPTRSKYAEFCLGIVLVVYHLYFIPHSSIRLCEC